MSNTKSYLLTNGRSMMKSTKAAHMSEEAKEDHTDDIGALLSVHMSSQFL